MAGDLSKEDFVAECKRRREEGLILRGNTYPIRQDIKDEGGIWDRKEKGWLMPNQESLTKMDALVATQDKS